MVWILELSGLIADSTEWFWWWFYSNEGWTVSAVHAAEKLGRERRTPWRRCQLRQEWQGARKHLCLTQIRVAPTGLPGSWMIASTDPPHCSWPSVLEALGVARASAQAGAKEGVCLHHPTKDTELSALPFPCGWKEQDRVDGCVISRDRQLAKPHHGLAASLLVLLCERPVSWARGQVKHAALWASETPRFLNPS